MADASYEEDVLEEMIFSELSSDQLAAIILSELSELPERTLYSNRGFIDTASMTDAECRQMFRFEKDDLERLRTCLQIPDVVKNCQGIKVSGKEALCMCLRRLSYPNRLCDLQREFGRAESTISLLTNDIMRHIVGTFGHLLEELKANKWLTQGTLKSLADVSTSTSLH